MAPSGHSVAQSTVQRPLSNPTSVHNALVRLHRWLGLATMFFLIAAGLSGSALVFRAELDAALNPDLFSSRSLSPVQSPAAIADAVSRAHPEFVITETPLTAERGRTLAMSVAPARTPLGYDQIFVDPHDGRIVGTRSVAPGWDRRHFVEGLYQFHYTLLGGTIGRWVMGVVAALWTVGNLIGFYLTLPRDRPFWQRWARMWMVARKTRFARFCLDLHRAGGLWLFVGLLILSVTSVEINFYDELFVPATNLLWSAPKTPFDDGAPKRLPQAARALAFASAQRHAEVLAAKDHPGWTAAFATASPELGLIGVSFVRPRSDVYSGLGPVAYDLDARSGRLVFGDDPYNDGVRGAVMRSLYPLHSGRIWGWPTRILVLLLGIAVTVFSLSGFYVWWRRRAQT